MLEIHNNEARDAAILWARQILETEFIILDTETTGLDGDAEAVSIGIVSKTGEVLLYALLRHEKPSSQKALAVHALTWEMTRSGLLFAEIHALLLRLLSGRAILAYNADFDMRILAQTCRRYGKRHTEAGGYQDVMGPFAEFYGEWSDFHESYTWKSLTFAAGHFNIDLINAHGAADDAITTLRVVEAMARAPLSEETHAANER